MKPWLPAVLAAILPALPARAAEGGPGPAVPVVLAKAEVRPFPVIVSGVGTVQPERAAAVRARVDGEIQAVHVAEGQEVKAGDPLFSLDSRAAQIQLRQAEAALARDQAQLARARAELARSHTLLDKGYQTPQKQELAASEVAVLEAAIKADEAAIDAARLAIDYAAVRAPIAGRAGAVALKEGNVVRAAETTPLVTITQMSPVLVAFTVPERDLPAVREHQAKAPLLARVRPGAGDGPAQDCHLAFIDSAIEAATGTILLKARCDNAARTLWPGQYVSVELTVRVEPAALVVPDGGVQIGQRGPYVFAAREDGTVALKAVRVLRQERGLAVIGDGLAAGERVVVEGQSRLTDGARFSERKP